MKSDILKLNDFKKIAVMGGTFDPIHYGHLVAAETVRQELGIERVVFIPTGRPPHKEAKKIAHEEHRYLMTVLATVTNPYFDVSRIEIDRPGTTYTIDTVREIRKICKEKTKIFFITGADAINEILTWKEAEKLLEMCEFVAVTRPEYNKEKLLKRIEYMKNNFESRIHILDVPALAISSTDIRNRVIAKKTIKYLLPEEVEKYIIKFGLYTQGSMSEKNIDDINKKLHYVLSPERFAHTQSVAYEALKLAKHYNCNEEKAFLAGLLHDCAKNFSNDEKIKMCKEFDVEIDDILFKQPDLIHSFLGAEVAKHDYFIDDEDILNAIRYHTTGRAKMSKLEKIIYLADYIEPTRKSFDGIEQARELSYKDLNKAIKFVLKQTIEYNTNKNRLIHPLSLEAYKYYKNK